MKKTVLASLLAAVSICTSSYASTIDLENSILSESKTNIGEKSETNLVFSKQYQLETNDGNIIRHKLTHPGADYIKLHFKDMQLTGNAKLIVRSEAGNEQYTYSATNMAFATTDLKQGDDGISSFSTMSISNDSVIIEYFPDNASNLTEFGSIDSYYFGNENQINTVSSITPQSTCGANERRDVQCWASTHPTEFERSRPVARLVIGGRSLCTGWRVGSDNKLFTNNHCVESAAELASTEVWFNYQHKSCNGSTRETVVKVTGKEFLKTDYTLDYTLFSVNNFASIQQFGYFGLDVRNASQGERIYIPQHGSGNPKELSIESDRDSNGLCQVNSASVNGRGSNTDIGYYCDTIGGSSGSPVLAAATNNVIALHHLGGCYNKGAKISKIWPQVASYFNNVVPVGDNGNVSDLTARFSYSCNFENCSFDASESSSSAGISNYQWQFGNGQTDVGQTTSYIYTTNGQYDVTLTITDVNNTTHSLTKTITVTSDTPPVGDQLLLKGVSENNISGLKSDALYFYIDVPENASDISFTMSGGTGDADMYVKLGSKPTTTSYDCRPYKNGNNESCNLNSGAGKYFVMLLGYSNFSGVSLLADYKTNTTPPPVGDTVEITPRAYGYPGYWAYYSYQVPVGKTSIILETSSAIGDLSLFVKKDSQVSETQFDCKSELSGTGQSCTLAVTPGQNLNIGLLGITSYDWVKLVAKH